MSMFHVLLLNEKIKKGIGNFWGEGGEGITVLIVYCWNWLKCSSTSWPFPLNLTLSHKCSNAGSPRSVHSLQLDILCITYMIKFNNNSSAVTRTHFSLYLVRPFIRDAVCSLLYGTPPLPDINKKPCFLSAWHHPTPPSNTLALSDFLK